MAASPALQGTPSPSTRALFTALLTGAARAALAVLEGPEAGSVQHVGPVGFSTLHAAVIGRCRKALPALVAAGAPLDCTLRDGMQGISRATKVALQQLLSPEGLAALEAARRGCAGFACSGSTPLGLAVALKDVRSARVLLEAGADPNAGGSSSTPMCFLRGGRQGLVAPATRQLLGLLLRHGADCLRIKGHSLYSFLWHFVNSGLGTSLLAHLERQRAAGTLQLASVATALQLLDGAITAGHLPLFSHALAALQGLAAAPGGQPTAAGGRAGAQQLQLAPPEFYVFRNTLLAAVHSAHASAPQIARTLLSCQLALDLARQQPRCLPDLLVEVLRCSRRMREAALPLHAAAGVSPRDALLAATHGDVEPDALAALLALGSPAVDTSAVTAEVGRHASYSCLIHRLLHLGNVPHVWSGGDDCLRWEAVQRWEQMRRLELLLEAGCRPTVWHNVAPPAFLGRGDAPLPVLDPFDFHEQGVVDSRLGFIARGGTWSPATHHRWPEAFKAAARTLLLAASSAGAQAAAERHGGGAAAECAAKRRRRQRAAHSVRDERGGGLAALPGSALMRVLELAAMPVSDWL